MTVYLISAIATTAAERGAIIVTLEYPVILQHNDRQRTTVPMATLGPKPPKKGAHSGARGARFGAIQSALYAAASVTICTQTATKRADTSGQDVGPNSLTRRKLRTLIVAD